MRIIVSALVMGVVLLCATSLPAPPQARADPHVIATIQVPDSSDVAVNSVTGKAYVTDHLTGMLHVIDIATLARSDIFVGDTPDFVVVDEDDDRIYVGGYEGPIKIVDGATRTIVGTLPTGAFQLAIDPVLDHLYVSHAPGEYVSTWDVNTGLQLAYTYVGGRFPTGMAVDTTNHRVYVSVQLPSLVTTLNGVTGELLSSPRFVAQREPWEIGYNPANNDVYTVEGYISGPDLSQTIWTRDVSVAGATTSLAWPSGQFTGGGNNIAVDEARNLVYIGGGFDILVLDGATNSVLTTVPIGSYSLSVDRVSGRVFVASGGSDILVLEDTASGPPPTPAPVGGVVDTVVSSDGQGASGTLIWAIVPTAGLLVLFASTLKYRSRP